MSLFILKELTMLLADCWSLNFFFNDKFHNNSYSEAAKSFTAFNYFEFKFSYLFFYSLTENLFKNFLIISKTFIFIDNF